MPRTYIFYFTPFCADLSGLVDQHVIYDADKRIIGWVRVEPAPRHAGAEAALDSARPREGEEVMNCHEVL